MNTDIELDLVVDLNTMDDTGLPWAFLDEPSVPSASLKGLTSSAPARSELLLWWLM